MYPADLGDVLLDPRDLARYRLRAGRSPHPRCGKQIGGWLIWSKQG
jgi:hypothetical protein